MTYWVNVHWKPTNTTTALTDLEMFFKVQLYDCLNTFPVPTISELLYFDDTADVNPTGYPSPIDSVGDTVYHYPVQSGMRTLGINQPQQDHGSTCGDVTWTISVSDLFNDVNGNKIDD